MARKMLMGLAAGACGSAALNMATNLDMAVRGRPESEVPGKIAEKLASSAGIRALSERGTAATGDERKEQEQRAAGRRGGVGALMGYLVGLGVGTAYGVIRPALRNVPIPLAGVVLGAVAMAASDVPAVGVGATDPSRWGMAGWLADLLPHLVYGLVTALAFDAFTAERAPQQRSLLARFR